MEEFKIIAKTFQGLEEVLAKELTQLGANNIEIGKRMVSFTGDQEMLYRANFCLRTAVRVLKPIKEFQAQDADEVYEAVKQMPWDQYMDEKTTFLVDSVVYSENFRHSKFVSYRVKDAVADYFREKTGNRPNVSLSDPDLRISVHISETDVTIALDSSGESLHKRGYRTGTVAAPINEVLAAGMILLTGWDGQCDFIDPFCGSGTIAIEAALIAQNIYPGVFREEFGFERWRDFDEDLLERIYNDDSQERDFDYKIYGYDINRQAVAIAQDNVRSAGVGKIVDIQQQDFYEFEWNGTRSVSVEEDDEAVGDMHRPAIIVTNPPYGERITTDDILELYETIGQRLKQQFVGNEAWILSYHYDCFDRIGLRPSTKYALYNGALPCEFRKYQVFAGKLSDRRGEGIDIKTDEDRQRNAKFRPNRRQEDEGTFDGYSWRGEDSRERKDFGRGRERERKTERRPLFEGDDEPELNRKNFKWGDRSASYRDDSDRRDSERKPYRRDDRGGDFKGHDRKGDSERKPYRRDDRGGDFKGRDRKGDSDRKPFRRDGKDSFQKGRGEGKKPFRRDGSDGKDPKWGFDSEGRPFRRGHNDD